MILKPRNFEEMVNGLHELKPHKRRVIVLVGRHPNEGTINIAKRHHTEWEKHGAVVVRIPAQWTPHGFWHAALRKGDKVTPEEVQRAVSTVPQDAILASHLCEAGFDVPFVDFHATTESAYNSPQLHFYVYKPTRLFRYSSFKFRKRVQPHPNAVVAEYYFHDPTKDRRNAWNNLRGSLLRFDNARKGQLNPTYLAHNRISRYYLDYFSSKFAPGFKAMLAHLAETGLAPRGKI